MPSSSPDNTLTIVYSPWKKLLAFLGLGLALLFCWVALKSDLFIVETSLVVIAAFIVWDLLDTLLTRSICFHADKIVKTGYLRETAIPTHALIAVTNQRQQTSRFFHGSDRNIGESIKVKAWFISPELRLWLESYQRNIYRLGGFTHKPASAKSAACVEFERTTASFNFLFAAILAYLLIYVVYASCLSDQYLVFNGYASGLQALPIRSLFYAFALAAFWLLQSWAGMQPAERNSSYANRVQHARRSAFRSALTACAVAGMGLPLFLLFGNKLDFYGLLFIGFAYYYFFYPRLSAWEKLLQADDFALHAYPPQARPPRRSLQVSLALLGGMSLAAYLAESNPMRIADRECRDEYGNIKQCPSSNSSGGSGSWGGGGDSDSRGSVKRGGFGSFGHAFSSFGG